jgi:hypothetical protein
MTTLAKVGAFVVALVLVFVGARGIGVAVGPLDVEAPAAHDDGGHAEDAAGHAEHHEASGSEAAEQPGGLAVSSEGYTLRVVSRPLAGPDRPLRFVVDGPDGEPVTSYDEVHEKRLHLIKIRRDGAGYEHVHPTMAADGTWTAQLDLDPGSSRLFADFTPTGGPELVLGTDVEVPGDYAPETAPPVTTTATVGGYEVAVEGELVPGESSPLTLTVTRDGEPVTDLQPYLGAYGHLVALREGDLAYLHVHPEEPEGAAAGPEIPFLAEVPSTGRYRLFLDFKHAGVVRTAGFTLEAGDDHGH